MTAMPRRDTSTHELGLFRAGVGRYLPRGRDGRFVAVRHSAARRAVLARAAAIRDELGLSPLPVLDAATAIDIASQSGEPS